MDNIKMDLREIGWDHMNWIHLPQVSDQCWALVGMKLEGSLPYSQVPSNGPILSQINPIHTIPSYLSKIHFNIIHPPTPWSSQWPLSFWLSHQYPIRMEGLGELKKLSYRYSIPRTSGFVSHLNGSLKTTL
jgi:hypothetical protein